jgi:hypothetical protein
MAPAAGTHITEIEAAMAALRPILEPLPQGAGPTASELAAAIGHPVLTTRRALAALADEPDPLVRSLGRGRYGGYRRTGSGPDVDLRERRPAPGQDRAEAAIRSKLEDLPPGGYISLEQVAAEADVSVGTVRLAMLRVARGGEVESFGPSDAGGWRKVGGRPGVAANTRATPQLDRATAGIDALAAELPPGAVYPSIVKQAEQYGVCSETVTRALHARAVKRPDLVEWLGPYRGFRKPAIPPHA